MFGLWFSILGLLFGVLCSHEAKKQGRSYQDWFMLGFIFSVAAFIALRLLPSERSTPKTERLDLSIDEKLPLSKPIF